MSNETEILNILDLPDNLSDSICEHIQHFTVALLRIFIKDNVQTFSLIGSGTLVILNDKPSIITAEHVLEQIFDSDQLGLLTSFRGNPHRYAFDTSHISIHKVAKGDTDSRGPDIGVITLPENNIGRLKAEKSFFNIDKRRKRFQQKYLETNRGFWFTCGIPGEFEVNLVPRNGFKEAKGYQGLCGISGIRNEYEDAGYDYIELSIEYGNINPELPNSFGGVSGSGVWQVPLIKTADGKLHADEYVLSGVAFYQTDMKGNHRILKCHGRKTIYKVVPDQLRS